ncbi:hypothetical protein Sinac_6507 [Singulisphaera acidiphila DSM 18658]|uniref:Uncharacterized protein n=1 Tax=Singulisphaera acidiphila (strain ATCC BAA-1392 / DSM 18658 / VKM B-2454 / MOB10) TaxID=886293 RepID=L0DP02_SINAD|nr:hypothetical protein Sinac_6507 [Singulisphaera acidiphila DSM 18658]
MCELVSPATDQGRRLVDPAEFVFPRVNVAN